MFVFIFLKNRFLGIIFFKFSLTQEAKLTKAHKCLVEHNFFNWKDEKKISLRKKTTSKKMLKIFILEINDRDFSKNVY